MQTRLLQKRAEKLGQPKENEEKRRAKPWEKKLSPKAAKKTRACAEVGNFRASTLARKFRTSAQAHVPRKQGNFRASQTTSAQASRLPRKLALMEFFSHGRRSYDHQGPKVCDDGPLKSYKSIRKTKGEEIESIPQEDRTKKRELNLERKLEGTRVKKARESK